MNLNYVTHELILIATIQHAPYHKARNTNVINTRFGDKVENQ